MDGKAKAAHVAKIAEEVLGSWNIRLSEVMQNGKAMNGTFLALAETADGIVTIRILPWNGERVLHTYRTYVM